MDKTTTCRIKQTATREEIFNIIRQLTHIHKEHLRIIFESKEIYPTKKERLYNWKKDDQLHIKIRILGGKNNEWKEY